jgi:hypothetical protein
MLRISEVVVLLWLPGFSELKVITETRPSKLLEQWRSFRRM